MNDQSFRQTAGIGDRLRFIDRLFHPECKPIRTDRKIAGRQRLPLDVLEALRDAEADLSNWKRSPLRPLLVAASARIDRDRLCEIAQEVSDATSKATDLPEVEEVADSITARLTKMVGPSQALQTALGFAPTDPDRLLRTLRLFIDGTSREITDASLGSANLLYLALKSLQLEQLVEENSREHTFLAIEEPEAHLHPHVQRLVYRDLLRAPDASPPGSNSQQATTSDDAKTVLLTTHSPHIVSVAPLRSLVLLRNTPSNGTKAASTAEIKLSDEDVADLERYIDVTRGECLFAKALLFVEGDSEKYLLPIIAKNLGYDLDELGITVCSISGTNFSPYVKLFGRRGLNVPFAVATDLDPRDSRPPLGHRRVIRLLKLIASKSALKGKTDAQLLKLAPTFGLFMNSHTLEVDLFECGFKNSIPTTLVELAKTNAARLRAKGWLKSPATLDKARFLKDVEAVGKGRFAQRLSTRLTKALSPPYFKEALEYLTKQIS